MGELKILRCGVFSVVKHDYLPRAVAAHARFELVVVADDVDQPDWVHAVSYTHLRAHET